MAENGHRAELVAPTGPDVFAGFPVRRARGATLPFYPDFKVGLETRRRLRQVFSRFRPDVVHIASPAMLGHQAARAAEELGLPAVAIYQTDLVGFAERYDVPGGARAMARLTRRIHDAVDLTLAPSTASLAQLRALGVERCQLWQRGVDRHQFHPRHRDDVLRDELTDGGERFLVGYVGRLAPEKELEQLAILARDDRYRVVMVGGGPAEARLREALPLARFLGVRHGAELSALYASFDVFVHTGRYETYCQAAQEALASGIPVVAPRAGGPIDLVADGANGFLYEPGDAEELATKVAALADDVRLRRAMGATARRGISERSWEAINDQLIQHYREVIWQRRVLGRVS